MGGLEFGFGLSPEAAGALIPDSVRENAARIGAAAVETVERDAWLEVIDEMPVVGDLWSYEPERTGANGFVQPATWALTDRGRSVAMWGAIGVAVALAVVGLRGR